MTDIGPIRGDMTMEEVRNLMVERVAEGMSCPLCGRYSKIYARKLNDRIGRVLIAMWHKNGDGWVHVPTLGVKAEEAGTRSKSGEHAFAKHFDLIEQNTGKGGRGFWRLTPLGVKFVHNQINVPFCVWVFHGQLLQTDDSKLVSIRDVLGTRWDYDQLMRSNFPNVAD